jgi:drug/metabolite transporter (DMT)-like permease
VTRRKADLALFFNVLVWGATFILVKTALLDISPLLFLALRFSLASLALLLLFRPAAKIRYHWKTVAAGCLVGCFLYTGFLFQTLGLRLTSAPKSAFITGLTSLMVPLLTRLVYKSRPQLSEVAGVLVATVGLGLMTLRGDIGSMGRGDVLTVFGAAAFAAHIVTLGHFSKRMSFELLSIAQVGAAAVLALSLFGWWETPHLVWRPAVIYAILITGILATALAFTIQAWAQQHTTATRTALIYMLEPVVAWITSYLWAGEGLSGRAAVGAVLILGGVVLVEVKPLNPRLHPSN